MAELIRTRQFLLRPSAEQLAALRHFAGVGRLVYNLALEQRVNFWRQYFRVEGKHITSASQGREVTQLRAEFDWIRAVHTDVTTSALRDLEKAFRSFFAGRAGYPTPRRKRTNESFSIGGRSVHTRALNAKWSEVRIPGIGWVKYRSTRQVEAQLKNITVRCVRNEWFISIRCEVPARSSSPAASVGIDRGVANTIALSTGELLTIPNSIGALEKRRRSAQRALSRKRRGSNRYRRQRDRLSGLSRRIAAIRADWLHRQSTAIANSFGVVAMEKLDVKGMTASAKGTVEEPGTQIAQKRGLNRAIREQGWGIFARQLEYKIEERGGLLVYVNPAYTSQTCSACGVVDARSRESQAVFRCVACGHGEHADVGAAKEILRRSSALLDVEGARQRPDEASTMRASA